MKIDGIEYLKPNEIEHRSFEMIAQELSERGIVLEKENEAVMKRVIHTTADFDYVDTMRFSKNAVAIAKGFIAEGATIVTDTNMALSGINKKILAHFGGSVRCFMAEEEVARIAKERGTTRAAVSMEMAAKLPGPVIFAVGNAPTALIQLYEMMEKQLFVPNFVIGVPVGFVNVVAAKELILNSGVPYIVNAGRKGGSNVAAAICNALLYELFNEQEISADIKKLER
ncbi:MAG: precorrin-8X methylmutase [Lachnospiraceae bacterium]